MSKDSVNDMTPRKRRSSSQRTDGPKRASHITLLPGLNEKRSNNSHGVVLICGQGDCGQLGLGSEILERTKPVVVPNLKNIVDIVAGGMHTLCVNNTGKVFSWGCNDEGALGRDTSIEDSDTVPGEVNLPENIIQISAGDSHSAALAESGKLYAWGTFRDKDGSMGLTKNGCERTPVLLTENIAKISSGSDHLLLLTCDGKVYTCGCAEQGQLGRIPERSVVRTSRHAIDRLLTPKSLTLHPKIRYEFDQIWSGTYSSFVRDHDTGYVYAFGLNNYYQLGLEEPKLYMRPIVVNSFTPHVPWLDISGGNHHTIAVNNQGVTYALGCKNYGRLGLGVDCNDSTIPTVIPALEQKKVVNVSCGSCVSFAVTSDGEVYGWGMGTNHQLGLGSEDDVYEPTLITGKQLVPNSVIKVSSGGQHTVFLSKENTL